MAEVQYQPKLGESFRVRFSDHSDTDRILSFYDAHRHTYVVPREWELMERRVRLGSEILVENDRQDIVASSLAYPHYDTSSEAAKDDKHPRWTEFGSTRIIMNGYRLYQLMVAASVVQQFLMEPPTERFFAKIAPDNDKIHKLLGGDLAWPRYTPSDAQLLSIYGPEKIGQDRAVLSALEAQTPPPADGVTAAFNKVRQIPERWFYECDAPRLAHQARVILGYFDEPVITRLDSKTQEMKGQIKLDFNDLHLAGMFRPFVQALATHPFAPQDPQVAHQGMAAIRASFFNRNRQVDGSQVPVLRQHAHVATP